MYESNRENSTAACALGYFYLKVYVVYSKQVILLDCWSYIRYRFHDCSYDEDVKVQAFSHRRFGL